MSATTTTTYSVRLMGGRYVLFAWDAHGAFRLSHIVRVFDHADDALDAYVDLRRLEGSL